MDPSTLSTAPRPHVVTLHRESWRTYAFLALFSAAMLAFASAQLRLDQERAASAEHRQVFSGKHAQPSVLCATGSVCVPNGSKFTVRGADMCVTGDFCALVRQ